MIKGKTKSGFRYEVNERAFLDWDVITILRRLSKGEADDIPFERQLDWLDRLTEKAFGEEGVRKLIEHVEKQDPDGIAGMDVIAREVMEIMGSAKEKQPVKKSSPLPE